MPLKNKSMNKNRNASQITEDILISLLKSGNNGITVTPLIRKANLSHSRVNNFLQKLIQNNLVNEIQVDNKKVYIITERGQMYLEEYKKFSAIAESFGFEL